MARPRCTGSLGRPPCICPLVSAAASRISLQNNFWGNVRHNHDAYWEYSLIPTLLFSVRCPTCRYLGLRSCLLLSALPGAPVARSANIRSSFRYVSLFVRFPSLERPSCTTANCSPYDNHQHFASCGSSLAPSHPRAGSKVTVHNPRGNGTPLAQVH